MKTNYRTGSRYRRGRRVYAKREQQKTSYYKKNEFSGNLIRNDAGVGNISNYLTYASSPGVPYLTSTYSRYIALQKDRGMIIERVMGEIQNKSIDIMESIADALELKENEELNKMISAMRLSMQPDEFINSLNETRINGNQLNEEINSSLNIIRDATFRYRLGGAGSDEGYEMVRKAMEEGAPLQAFEEKGKFGKNVAYRGPALSGNDLFKAFTNVFEALSRPDLDIKGVRVLNESMSAAFNAFAQSIGKKDVNIEGMLRDSNVLTDQQVKDITASANKAIKQINSRLEKNETLKLSKNIFSYGYIAEVLTANYLRDFINQKIATYNSGEVVQPLNIEDFVISNLGGEANAYKTSDVGIQYTDSYGNKASLLVDVKFVGSRGLDLTNKAMAAYNSSMNFNFLEDGFDNIIKASSSDSLMMLYRAMVLNLAVNESYYLEKKERSFLVYNYMVNNEGYVKKFESDGSFPTLVSLNGRFFRFTEVLRKFGKMDLDSIVADKRIQLASAGSYSNPNPNQLYTNKLKAGKKVNYNRVSGFGREVEGLQSVIEQIESGYMGQSSKVKFRFKIQ